MNKKLAWLLGRLDADSLTWAFIHSSEADVGTVDNGSEIGNSIRWHTSAVPEDCLGIIVSRTVSDCADVGRRLGIAARRRSYYQGIMR
jgi:hypothetical protein